MKTENIIKALRLCNSDEGCMICPYRETDDCVSEVMEDALNLIEKLYKELNIVQCEQYINGRNDGIKEFAEKLKATYPAREDPRCTLDWCYTLDIIDEFVWKMTKN